MATIECQKVRGVDIPCALVGGGGGGGEGDLVALRTYEAQAASATAPMHAQSIVYLLYLYRASND